MKSFECVMKMPKSKCSDWFSTCMSHLTHYAKEQRVLRALYRPFKSCFVARLSFPLDIYTPLALHRRKSTPGTHLNTRQTHPNGFGLCHGRATWTVKSSGVARSFARVLVVSLDDALAHADLPIGRLGASVGAGLLIHLLEADLQKQTQEHA